jgi:beta-glucanase (GH16 family)
MTIRRFGFAVALLAACALFFSSCQSATGSDDDSSGSDTPVATSISASGLYRDSANLYASWADLIKGVQSDFAYGDWASSTSVAVANGYATMTIVDASWSGGTVGQVPPQADTGSYYDFTGVSKIKFCVRSSDLDSSKIYFILQDTSDKYLINKSLKSYGASAITSWTEVTIDVSAFTASKIKVAAGFILKDGAKGNAVQIKQFGFLDSSGANVDVAKTVLWNGYPVKGTTETVSGVDSSGNTRTLLWADEFNGASTTPDPATWTYDLGAGGWGNNEVQTYTNSRTNSYVSDGSLKIVAVKSGSSWTSARLKTKGLKEFTYGRVEFRAKVPVEGGSWPALWMLPTDSVYGQWPASGEIDVMEAATSTQGLNKVLGTTHCNAGYGGNGKGTGPLLLTDITQWHTYAMEWTESTIYWFYDGIQKGSYPNPGTSPASDGWPFDQDFHVVMNIAMGGNMGGTISTTNTSITMELDYVRVYAGN